MPKVTCVQVVYNNKKFIKPVFERLRRQTYKDFQVVAVIAGNSDGSKEELMQNFPEVIIEDPGYNCGFSEGHKLVFQKYQTDYFQLINPDLFLEPTYLEEVVKIMETDKNIGSATGKVFQYDWENQKILETLDTTGVTISVSGRGRDRGQHKIDTGQFDKQTEILAASGSNVIYRKEALDDVFKTQGEYFDPDFFMYWEDVDLGLRLRHLGYSCRFIPTAVASHVRTAKSNNHGYTNPFKFFKHHTQISARIKKLNYKNHILLNYKNIPRLHWQFIFRELAMFCYILIAEPSTLKVFPELITNLKKAKPKRKKILSESKLSQNEFEKLFTHELL